MTGKRWIKIRTDKLTFLRLVMICQCFGRYRQITGLDHGDVLATFNRGKMDLYRQKKDLKKFVANFLKIKDKSRFFANIEKNIYAFRFGRNDDFEALYGRFLDFWPLFDLPRSLVNSLKLLKYDKTAARIGKRLSGTRRQAERKLALLDQAIDRSVRPGWLLATPDEVLNGKLASDRLKKRRKAVLISERLKIKIITGGRAATWFKVFTQTLEAPAAAAKGRG